MKLETLIKNGARLLGMTYNYVNYQEWVSDVSLWNRDFNDSNLKSFVFSAQFSGDNESVNKEHVSRILGYLRSLNKSLKWGELYV